MSGLTRTVWDGDRVLHEIRYPDEAREQDTGEIAVPMGGKPLYGVVSYTFGAGLDHPLLIYRRFFGDTLIADVFGAMQVVVPHASWRGDYELGTFDDGTLRRCVEVSTGEPVDQTPVEGVPEPGEEPAPEAHTSEHCFTFDWPAQYLWMTHLSRRKAPTGPPVWGGSLIQNKRDLTGQLYMRNRGLAHHRPVENPSAHVVALEDCPHSNNLVALHASAAFHPPYRREGAMRKLALDLEALSVESFDTEQPAKEAGTVHALESDTWEYTCFGNETCGGGQHTCWDSCDIDCGTYRCATIDASCGKLSCVYTCTSCNPYGCTSCH